MKNIVLLIFLFVAAGKSPQAVEFCAPLGSTSASQISKKSDKSLLFKDNTCISKSKFGKAKKRKPKGIEIKSVGVSGEGFEFHLAGSNSNIFNYSSPELLNTSFFVMGRAPPLA